MACQAEEEEEEEEDAETSATHTQAASFLGTEVSAAVSLAEDTVRATDDTVSVAGSVSLRPQKPSESEM